MRATALATWRRVCREPGLAGMLITSSGGVRDRFRYQAFGGVDAGQSVVRAADTPGLPLAQTSRGVTRRLRPTG